MAEIVCIGELNPDLILSDLGADAPVVGTEQTFGTETLTLGSSTAITCVLLARLGRRTALGSKVGDDRYGRFCLGVLAREGVEAGAVRVAPDEATGVTIAVSYPRDRLLLTRYGTMATLCAADLPPDFPTSGRHLHVGSYFLLHALRPDLPGLFAAARAAGASTSLDLGWDPSGRWDRDALAALLPHVDVILPNRSELAAVTREEGPEAGLAALHALGARTIALKLGAEGGLCSGEAGIARHPGFPVRPVDTTGAGDAFNAGFLHARLEGRAPADCLALANACGALTAGAVGGTGGLPSLAAAEALIASATA